MLHMLYTLFHTGIQEETVSIRMIAQNIIGTSPNNDTTGLCQFKDGLGLADEQLIIRVVKGTKCARKAEWQLGLIFHLIQSIFINKIVPCGYINDFFIIKGYFEKLCETFADIMSAGAVFTADRNYKLSI